MVAMPSVNAAACVACILPTADACVVVGADIDVQQTSKHANKQTNEHTDMFASYCCIIWQLHHDSNISDNANVRAALIWRPMQCNRGRCWTWAGLCLIVLSCLASSARSHLLVL